MDLRQDPKFEIKTDGAQFDAAIDALMKSAFGPGRFAKAAHFLRVDNRPDYSLSRLAFIDGELIGACRIWPIEFEGGGIANFLGPIVISKAFQGIGLGQILVQECLKAIKDASKGGVFLVGDLEFFGRFGFETVEKNSVKLPLPALNGRILALNADFSKCHGKIRAPRIARK